MQTEARIAKDPEMRKTEEAIKMYRDPGVQKQGETVGMSIELEVRRLAGTIRMFGKQGR